MSQRKSNLVLLGVVALALLGGAFFWFAVGSPLLGVVFLAMGVLSLVWLWRTWSHPSRT